MSALAQLPDLQEMPRKRWTRQEFLRLATLDWFQESGRYELLDGEIVAKMTQGRPHISACMQTFRVLMHVFGEEHVQSQASIALDERNEPEPDVAVLREPLSAYLEDDPGPDDILLVVEVADATLRPDLQVKSVFYGRGGLLEYWVVNLRDRSLVVFRQPGPDGYGETTTLAEHESVAPLAAPQASVRVADLLPRA